MDFEKCRVCGVPQRLFFYFEANLLQPTFLLLAVNFASQLEGQSQPLPPRREKEEKKT